MSSVFDRLYKQETVSHERQKDEIQRERSKMEKKKTESAKKNKGAPLKFGHGADDVVGSYSPTPKHRPSSTRASQQSSFERLYHQETASSLALKATTGGTSKTPPPSTKPVRKKQPKSSTKRTGNIYDRLYQGDTASSRTRKSPRPTPTTEKQRPASRSQPAKNKKKTTTTPISSRSNEVEHIDAHLEALKLDDELDKLLAHSDEEFSNTKIQLRISQKGCPEEGFKPLDLSVSPLKGLNETLCKFDIGEISKQKMACEIINALFQRDFTPGEHWDIDSASATELQSDDGSSFDVVKEATWDWKDIYSVASSKATIHFLSNEIRIENYSYYVAG